MRIEKAIKNGIKQQRKRKQKTNENKTNKQIKNNPHPPPPPPPLHIPPPTTHRPPSTIHHPPPSTIHTPPLSPPTPTRCRPSDVFISDGRHPLPHPLYLFYFHEDQMMIFFPDGLSFLLAPCAPLSPNLLFCFFLFSPHLPDYLTLLSTRLFSYSSLFVVFSLVAHLFPLHSHPRFLPSTF